MSWSVPREGVGLPVWGGRERGTVARGWHRPPPRPASRVAPRTPALNPTCPPPPAYAQRAMGEFGAVSVISGNIIGQTQTLTLFVESAYKVGFGRGWGSEARGSLGGAAQL